LEKLEIYNKLQVFINKSLRKTLRIYWPDQITNTELWKRTKQPRIDLQIRRRKWGWPGHTLRELTDDITRQALQWKRQGKRSRGRPKNTWRRAALEGVKGVKNGVEGGRRTRGEERHLKGLKE